MTDDGRRSFPPPPHQARTLVLRAHPNPGSFNHALARAYSDATDEAGVTVDTIDTDALDFDLRLRGPQFGSQPLEPAIEEVQRRIAEAAHLVIAAPVWWGSVPASFKALIDRTFLPGWAYRTGDSAFPEPGLRGRTARVLLTMDAPGWWDRFKYGRSASRQLEHAWLDFVGIRSYGVTLFTSIEKSDAKTRERMLRRAGALGRRDAAKIAARIGRVAARPTMSESEAPAATRAAVG